MNRRTWAVPVTNGIECLRIQAVEKLLLRLLQTQQFVLGIFVFGYYFSYNWPWPAFVLQMQE